MKFRVLIFGPYLVMLISIESALSEWNPLSLPKASEEVWNMNTSMESHGILVGMIETNAENVISGTSSGGIAESEAHYFVGHHLTLVYEFLKKFLFYEAPKGYMNFFTIRNGITIRLYPNVGRSGFRLIDFVDSFVNSMPRLKIYFFESPNNTSQGNLNLDFAQIRKSWLVPTFDSYRAFDRITLEVYHCGSDFHGAGVPFLHADLSVNPLVHLQHHLQYLRSMPGESLWKNMSTKDRFHFQLLVVNPNSIRFDRSFGAYFTDVVGKEAYIRWLVCPTEPLPPAIMHPVLMHPTLMHIA